MPGARTRIPGLSRLARLYGVQPHYTDAAHERRAASPEALLALLRALGAPLEDAAGVRAALREREERDWRTPTEPVHLAWDGRPLPLELRLPAARSAARLRCTLTLEQGDARVWTVRLAELDVEAEHEGPAGRYLAKRLALPSPLPPGYHRLQLEGIAGDGIRAETLLICAPSRAFGPDLPEWGVFLPLYALRTRRALAIADLTDLRALARWVGELGAGAVGTLPLFATLGDVPGEPPETSPYAPATRLFWNELYLDLERAPGLDGAPAARRLLESPSWRRDARRELNGELIDYERVARLKGAVLRELARAFDPAGAQFRRYAASRPQLERYARFRAAARRHGSAWRAWPEPLRRGTIPDTAVDAEDVRYHLYAQWALDRQLRELSGRDGARPAAAPPQAGLYLDIPLGVSGNGFDVWSERQLFPEGICAGAPPDALFGGGQNWGFPPMHPEVLRQSGYRYLVDALRTAMPFARALRLDHVMSLHRLYWIPPGFGAREGTYVRYRADEMYAILSLESHRFGTRIVGEDLGTVQQTVRTRMGRHHIGRMYVLQYEAAPGRRPPVNPVGAGCVASLNTHDMPPFAGFWEGADIRDRRALGLLDAGETKAELRARRALLKALTGFLAAEGHLPRGAADRPQVLRAALAYLSTSDAWLVMAGLEDLWGETRPQNVPGTGAERANWRRRATRSLEAMRRDSGVLGALREIGRIRGESRKRDD